MIKLSDLGVIDGKDVPEENKPFQSWLIVGVSDAHCGKCGISLLILVSGIDFQYPGDVVESCLECKDIKLPMDKPMHQQSLLQDRLKEIFETGTDLSGGSVQRLISTIASNLAGGGVAVIGGPVEIGEVKRGEEDAPIPKGFRSISWLRRYEAEAIISSHKNKKGFALKSSQDEIVFQCNYFPDTSEEFRKFHSNVQAIRVNHSNQRVVGWIRLEEARAVIQAADECRDVEFGPIRYGNGGLVQFFAEGMEVAKKYRSTTRLLRKD